eukprot:COSAG06_NODE_820_length_12102_cov_16.846205_11_plen_101_part_00
MLAARRKCSAARTHTHTHGEREREGERLTLGVVTIGADAPIMAKDLLVLGGVVLLVIDAELFVDDKRLILPRNALLSIQQLDHSTQHIDQTTGKTIRQTL